MRAVRHDREAAIAMGIPAQRIFMVTFAIGTAMAAFGGVVAAPITTVDFRTGVDILPFCFMAVIIGGLATSAVTTRSSIVRPATGARHLWATPAASETGACGPRAPASQIGRASWRERVGQDGKVCGVAV